MQIKGLNEEKIKTISKFKNEDKSVLDFRLESYKKFKKLNLPSFGPTLKIDFDDIVYYESDIKDISYSWDKINSEVKDEFCSLGVVSSEKYMDGVGVQYQSEVIYHSMLEE